MSLVHIWVALRLRFLDFDVQRYSKITLATIITIISLKGTQIENKLVNGYIYGLNRIIVKAYKWMFRVA